VFYYFIKFILVFLRRHQFFCNLLLMSQIFDLYNLQLVLLYNLIHLELLILIQHLDFLQFQDHSPNDWHYQKLNNFVHFIWHNCLLNFMGRMVYNFMIGCSSLLKQILRLSRPNEPDRVLSIMKAYIEDTRQVCWKIYCCKPKKIKFLFTLLNVSD